MQTQIRNLIDKILQQTDKFQKTKTKHKPRTRMRSPYSFDHRKHEPRTDSGYPNQWRQKKLNLPLFTTTNPEG